MKKVLAFVALFGSVAYAANVVDVKVKALDGFGGDVGSVLTRCQTKAGAAYDPVTVTRDVKSLDLSGEFQEISTDVRSAADGVEVVFYVKRKMRYQAPLAVKGNKVLSESKIAGEAGLRDGALYGEGDLAVAAGKVRDAYRKKGYPDAKVTAVPETVSGNSCAITFVVDEGARSVVSGYEFDGAKSVAQSDLRKAIGVYPWWNPVGWFGEEPTSAEQLAQAAAKAREHYADLGYLDAAVGGPERVAAEDGRTVIRFTVDEGPRYRVGATSIEGLTRYSEADVREKSDLPEPGSFAGAKALSDAARRIAVAVNSGNEGLAYSRVSYRHLPSAKGDGYQDIVFVVDEGSPVVIDNIRIEGNEYTKDKVIRREIELSPGNRMLEDRADRSKRKLEGLDYFTRVNYTLRDTGKGRDASGAEYRDLVYEVEEKNTGAFMVGIGASSVDSVYVSAEVQQANFDLFAPGKYFRGGGQKARLYAQAGPRIQTYEASISEPHFLDRFMELSVEGYRRMRWYDDYDLIRSGGDVSLSYPMKVWNPANLWRRDAERYVPFGRFGVRWTGEFIEFDDVERGYWLYDGRTVSLKEEDRRYGDAFESVVRLYWMRSTCNNPRMPTSGSRTQLYVDLSAGGDNAYYKLGFAHRTYLSPWRGAVSGDSWLREHVLMVALRGETIDGISDDVPIYNRLFLGGPKSIRGIEYRNVSPMARRLRDGEPSDSYMPWGGQTLACVNIEYTVPIVKMFRVAAFTDLGSVGADEFDFDLGDTFAWTAGVGVRFDIPMFPIRLDFGFPIERPDHADKEMFSFTVGYDF